jgi:DNA replication protein DnaC
LETPRPRSQRYVDGQWEQIMAPNPRRDREMAFALRSYDIALRCDEIQATRPEGCWCLGGGSRGGAYCSCPEGEAALRKAEADQEQMRSLRTDRLWDAAAVPLRFQSFTLDNFPTKSALPAIRQEGSLLLHGSFGTGKTALAVGLLRERIEMGTPSLFTTVTNLLDRIRATYSDRNGVDEEDVLARVKTIPFLVLDDLGAERVTDWVEEKLFTIINERHDELRATIFTTNLTPKELAAHIGERTAWRVVEMCTAVRIDGPNLRAR